MTAWLEGTTLATWVRESPSIWAYPTILTLHTVGLGIVVGANAILDLRLLGWAPRMRIAALSPLFQLIVWGFVVNAMTGVLLFAADATAKSKQPVFYVKLALIFAALWCMYLAHRIVAGQRRDGSADTIPRHSSRLAVASLVLWAGAITAGRLMAYL